MSPFIDAWQGGAADQLQGRPGLSGRHIMVIEPAGDPHEEIKQSRALLWFLASYDAIQFFRTEFPPVLIDVTDHLAGFHCLVSFHVAVL